MGGRVSCGGDAPRHRPRCTLLDYILVVFFVAIFTGFVPSAELFWVSSVGCRVSRDVITLPHTGENGRADCNFTILPTLMFLWRGFAARRRPARKL